MVRDAEHSNRRITALEEALRAASIPIPPPQPAGAATVTVSGSTDAQGRQRNPIGVTAGGLEPGSMGFSAPGRKLQSLEGVAGV
jgi:hypothetical protein